MSINLSKGGSVNLSKEDPGLKKLKVALGWESRTTTGAAFDLDASAIRVGPDGKVLEETDFVFYRNLKTPDGSIVHSGDNRTGDGQGDDETLTIDLAGVPAAYDRILFPVSIHDKAQNFGMVRNAYVRVVNAETDKELARFDLSEDGGGLRCVVFGEVYRKDGDWKFKAVGQGYESGFEGLIKDCGMEVAVPANA